MSEQHDEIARPFGVDASHRTEPREFEKLVALIESQPGNAAYPRLAEAYRRAGFRDRARAVAALGLESAPELMAGRVALGLALLDLGEDAEARREFESILGSVPGVPAGLLAEPPQEQAPSSATVDPETDAEHPVWATPLAEPSTAPISIPVQETKTVLRPEEIDLAFESAEADSDAMLDANSVAEEAMRSAIADEPDDTFSAAEHPRFATRTMADILEGQGDRAGAENIRASFDDGTEAEPEARETAADAQAGIGDAAPIIATLESWLENIRRKVA